MRYTKADVVFLVVFLSPILLVASLFGLGSISWATNRMRMNSQAQELIGKATNEDAPTLESIFIPGDESAEELQVRRSNQAKWDELVLSFWFISRWLDSLTTMEEAVEIYRIVPPNHSSKLTQALSQLDQRTKPFLKQLDQLIASPNPSLSQTMSD